MKHISLFFVLGLLLLSACSVDVQQDNPNNETSIPTNLSDEFDKVDVQEFVSEWIQQAPTYAYDGQMLDLQEHIVLESYPAQHVLTYTFTSTSAGYGNRSDQMTAQVITDHTIVVRAVDGEITSAIIDERYDELNQELIQEQESNESVSLSFTPEQCESYPWDEWYADGNINYVQEPTQEQLITDYYASQGVEVEVTTQQSDMLTCQACGCPHSYSFIAQVDSSEVEILQADGWN